MADWHPVQTLHANSWVFPRPGTTQPYAEIRHLPVKVGDRTVWAFRAVTWAQPRELIGAGYFGTLEEAARECHRLALASAVPSALNEQRR
ncbi:hypothetical protein [Herbiconiux sp. VKM Ac-2851]|uniref:hypothetical protein n=1 Tax=Herbiconiux sp. VKM Ac-2851 TaxID=2739025 RepID=UPI0015650FD9|nr:hypothetical protein [Herbiconiux sp. VKM Ac-2851]NQX35510.1 hypothetical protein [Herbiconiux sp. VKM Ac-2851]